MDERRETGLPGCRVGGGGEAGGTGAIAGTEAAVVLAAGAPTGAALEAEEPPAFLTLESVVLSTEFWPRAWRVLLLALVDSTGAPSAAAAERDVGVRRPLTTGLSTSFSWVTGDGVAPAGPSSFLSLDTFRLGFELPVLATGLGGWPWGGGPLGGAPTTGGGPRGPRPPALGCVVPLASMPLVPLGLFTAPPSLGAPASRFCSGGPWEPSRDDVLRPYWAGGSAMLGRRCPGVL